VDRLDQQFERAFVVVLLERCDDLGQLAGCTEPTCEMT
jgi:hypothetical protein